MPRLGLGSSLSGGIVQDPFSNAGYITFDGANDYVDCGRDSSLDVGTGDFSLSAWIKTSVSDDQTIMSKGSGGAGGKRYSFSTNSSGYLVGNLDDNTASTNITGGTDVSDNAWHHVVIVYDRDGNGQAYLDNSTDGSAVDITGSDGTLNDTGKDFCIGVFSHDEADAAFTGSIDEVAIFTKVLTSGEISTLYGGGAPGTAGNANEVGSLVGYWRMEEGTGTTAADSSANSNTGTLKNSPTWATH